MNFAALEALWSGPVQLGFLLYDLEYVERSQDHAPEDQ